MESDAALLGQRPQGGDGIDESVGVVTRTPDDRDGVAVDEGRHCLDIGNEIIGERGIAHLDAHPMRSLAQRDMRRDGQDDVGARDTSSLACLLPIGVEGRDQAVASPTRDDAHRLRRMQHVGNHRNDLALELRGRRIHVALQHIGMGVVTEHVREESIVLMVTAIEAAGDPPCITLGIFGSRHHRDIGPDGVSVDSLLRDVGVRGRE